MEWIFFPVKIFELDNQVSKLMPIIFAHMYKKSFIDLIMNHSYSTSPMIDNVIEIKQLTELRFSETHNLAR